MLTSGDVVELDLGPPSGREAGLRRPAIVVTAQRVLDESASVVQIVPITSTIVRLAQKLRLLRMATTDSRPTLPLSANTSDLYHLAEWNQ